MGSITGWLAARLTGLATNSVPGSTDGSDQPVESLRGYGLLPENTGLTIGRLLRRAFNRRVQSVKKARKCALEHGKRHEPVRSENYTTLEEPPRVISEPYPYVRINDHGRLVQDGDPECPRTEAEEMVFWIHLDYTQDCLDCCIPPGPNAVTRMVQTPLFKALRRGLEFLEDTGRYGSNHGAWLLYEADGSVWEKQFGFAQPDQHVA